MESEQNRLQAEQLLCRKQVPQRVTSQYILSYLDLCHHFDTRIIRCEL